MTLEKFVGEFLTFLEQRENRLLSWGFYNVRWSVEEIEEVFDSEVPEELRAAWDELVSQGRSLPSLMREMHTRNLLYQVPGSTCYRTRFAEGVRLVANLRQMFREDDWATGPRLVSDIKIHLAPRAYPRRDQSAAEVWRRLSTKCPPKHLELIERCFFALAAKQGGNTYDFAGFQARAFQHILEKYGASGFSGSVICAGTASGKTKAFYVPAFLGLVPELRQPSFTKVIAIYPRNVLLADQLREAIAEAEKLRPVLTAAGIRPIRFGALLGATPFSTWFEAKVPSSFHWERRASGAVIPYLKSPTDGASELIWRDADRRAGRTRLYRQDAQEPDVPDGVLLLTREQLMKQPPDVLFLSVEMLNREMGNQRWQRTFGIGQGKQSPRLLLLDEAHAHEGLKGAQVAWVLRRWRHWAQLPSLHVVGLSATLSDAPQHLARLAALPPAQVKEFRPVSGLAPVSEMESEGVEYNLAVKGDPAAGASLLASSIQAGMLLTRLLTPRYQAPSAPDENLRPEIFYRKKVFGFSDNLDSVNRWLSDMVDAETNLRLARLRSLPDPPPPVPLLRRRIDEGQIWLLPQLLGHDLRQPLNVSRCSSDDPGADPNSDLIIATSSLEVGFDDPDVGALLHHKHPKSMSSFIQRKGRAGRTRGSRPWTILVLSDYGGDRWAFHTAERFFLPEVEAVFLPVGNPYVTRVQIALFLLDWLGRKVDCDVFRCFARPATDQHSTDAQLHAIQLLRGLLEQGSTWKEFRGEIWQFYREFSGVADQELASSQLDDLLWYEPRPLLLQVVPNLLRKLEAQWRRAYPDASAPIEDAGARRPIPQFIPKVTFAEIDVGEAILEFESFGQRAREPEAIPISLLLFEVCPGRISKRFATFQGEPGFWNEYSPQLIAGANTTSIVRLFSRSIQLESIDGVRIHEPAGARVIHRPSQINDSSNASWMWITTARANGVGERLPLREEAPWRGVFSEAEAFMHVNGAWLELVRYAESCRFEIRQRGRSLAGTLTLQCEVPGQGVQREAVGHRLRVDGFRFLVSEEHLRTRPQCSPETIERFRKDYFVHRMRTSPVLTDLVNSFQAEWLAQISLAMLTATAILRGFSMAAAQEALRENRPAAAERVLDSIFQVRGIRADGEDVDARLKETLLELWRNPIVSAEIAGIEPVLWQPVDLAFQTWVQQRYVATLCQALRAAMVSMAPQVSEDDLVVDVILGHSGAKEILVTELSPGGLGQIETITREIQRQPHRFLEGIDFALHYCPRQETTTNLLAVLESAVVEAQTGGDLAYAFAAVRAATGFVEIADAKTNLCTALQSRYLPATRSTVVAVVTKLLRPASSVATDSLVMGLNRAWRRQAERFGLVVPLRTFAYCCVHYEPLRRRLRTFFAGLGGGETPSDPQLYAQLQQLLFDTCEDSCPECLDHPNRFNDFGMSSRALAREWLALEIEEVSLDSCPEDWPERAHEVLRQRGRVQLVASASRRAMLAQGLPGIVTTEIELSELRVQISLGRVTQSGGFTRAMLFIRDFVNG